MIHHAAKSLGGIPKWSKGAVSKTVSGVMLQPGFESLFLRQWQNPVASRDGFFLFDGEIENQEGDQTRDEDAR